MARPLSIPHPLPSCEQLHELLSYDRETGLLTWRRRAASSFNGNHDFQAVRWNSIYAGKIAGGGRPREYRRLMIEGVQHLAHRVIWKMEIGEEPIEIDHIDGDKTNNRFGNLRSVTRPTNMRNKALYINNSSGVVGVEFHKRDKVWIAKIGVGEGKQIHLGSFKTKDEAVAARIGAQIVADFHENHGRTAIKP